VNVFLSHNKNDAEASRRIGVHLQLAGANVWFDEWEIRAGDSIPGKISEGLENFETFLILWSSNAKKSRWVNAELDSALHRAILDPSLRVIPILLDDSPIPPLLASLKAIRFDDPGDVAAEVMGFKTEMDRIRAIQSVLDEASIEVAYFPGYGAAVGCLDCGAGIEALEGWSQTDYSRDDQYAGVRCTLCGWNDGAEI
jgi:hypothetical protein